ncbi:MAG: SCE4755 family polysaccharide monooxygenase-like protein [Bdellovibrionales bacterium]
MKGWILSGFALLFILIPKAYGHARLKGSVLPPRSNNAGLKTGPCGGVSRTASPKVFQAGETITIEWEETVQHPGEFRFSFSRANDQNFTLLKTVTDSQDGTKDLPHSYSTTITLPSQSCDACTIQMIQIMTENPANPSYYYSCADIKIESPVRPSDPPVDPPIDPSVDPPVDPLSNPPSAPEPLCD